MGLRTYKTEFKHGQLVKEVSIKAKKDLAKAIVSRLSKLGDIGTYTRNLHGIRGCTEGFNAETSSLSMALFSPVKVLPKQADFDIEYDQWIDGLPNLITAENMKEVITSADVLFNKYVIVEDNRRTADEESERVAKMNKQEEERKAAAAEQAKKDAVESEKLLAEYPYLEQQAKSKRSSWALAAFNMKRALLHEYPGLDVSVKSDCYSMGCSADATWIDGPTVDEAKHLVNRHQYGGYDYYTDCQTSSHDVFGKTFGEAKHCFASRNMSENTRAVLTAWAEEHFQECEAFNACDPANLAYRLFVQTSLPVGATVTGVEPIPHDYPFAGSGVHDFYRITVDEAPKPEPKPKKAGPAMDTADGDTLAIIESGHAEGNLFYLPDGHLSRDLYVKVNKVLSALGGKWNRKQKCHVFDRDIEAEILAVVDSGEVYNKKKGLQIFETPEAVAARMVELADIQPGHRVLEPSAGTGNLLRAMGYGPYKVAVEIDPENTGKLAGLAEVHEMDFLASNSELGEFDRIVMNPPFHGGADIKHIEHAYSYLKPGGMLVALCANGPRQQAAFMNQVDYWEELPAGSFKEAGTNVNVALLVWSR